jgi:hypothetical protein
LERDAGRETAGTVARPTLKIDRIHHWMLGVQCSTCPQCLDSGVSSIQPFDVYTDVSTNQMQYAWQAGVRPARNALKLR